jgi:hypothetical protein
VHKINAYGSRRSSGAVLADRDAHTLMATYILDQRRILPDDGDLHVRDGGRLGRVSSAVVEVQREMTE